jgi:uncharacterized membrane protein
MISTSHFHPMIVHFPIALVAFGFIADVASLLFKKEACLSKTGFYLLLLGTLSALAAVFTGTFFTSEMSGAAGDMKDTHEMFAWITVGILLVTCTIRLIMLNIKPEKSWVKWSTLILYGLAAISVSITGFYGGTLVYSYMMPL